METAMKILVIDDDKGIRAFLAEFLSKFGEVTTAVNGVNGLDVFMHSGGFDVVFTDRTMPGGVLGEEVVREIKCLSPQTFIVFMSGEEEDMVSEIGLAAGADKILHKPFKLVEIKDLIREFFLSKG